MTTKKKAVKRIGVCSVTNEVEYHAMLERIRRRFAETFGGRQPMPDVVPLFTTDAEDLFGAYVSALPAKERQHHNCHACRDFMERYGGLVSIDEDGCTTPAVLNEDDATGIYAPAIAEVARLVRRASVTGVFKDKADVWGKPVTGDWRHFGVDCALWSITGTGASLPHKLMAEKAEDFKNVLRALADFPLALCRSAVTILESEALYRSEKVLGQAKWLYELHELRANALDARRRENLVWRAVATAPSGFCHPRSSMIGTLLDDLKAGLPFETVKERFAAKMHPLSYQRPTEAPNAQTIEQAEKLVARLGIANSLKRRYARLEEVEAMWTPKNQGVASAGHGVFSQVRARSDAEVNGWGGTVDAGRITWAKFNRDVLPRAFSIHSVVPVVPANFAALVTATDPAAPPIIQWDTPERRNPVSWYLYLGGSMASRWNLTAGAMVAVTAVCLKPPQWYGGKFPHQSPGVLFILDGCREKNTESLALFPEVLKAELHGIRAVIEAYSKTEKITGSESATACGLLLDSGSQVPIRLVVEYVNGIKASYLLDRWE